ncbi:MAG: helix-turn-helix domain-containing protein [Pseudomonadota bacterium]|nr:helix-turn-helix domain-containing protein [Pseudomonadota bacterium]
MPECMKCGSCHCVKNGRIFGLQRYKCSCCGYQFTKESPHGKSIFQKLMVHDLYAAGISMRQIAPLVGVTAQTVSRWLKKWHSVYKNERGSSALLYKVDRANIKDCLDIEAGEQFVLISNKLPSGAKIRILLQTPQNH